MKYKCTNELHTLSFKDFTVSDVKSNNGNIIICTDGGVAKYDNSCNETLEERYISECEIQFMDVKIDKFILEGAKYYNADDVLLKETPDVDIDPSEYDGYLKKLTDGTLFFLSGKEKDDRYLIELAVDIEEDTYWINMNTEKVVVNFDRFMNRVMA